MTESDGDGSPTDDPALAPARFKDDAETTDTTQVNTVNGGHQRWNWSPVTSSGGTPTPPPPRPTETTSADSGGQSSFSFDLGGALARLGENRPPSPPAVEPVTTRETPVVEHVVEEPTVLPVRQPRIQTAPVDPSLPQRTRSAPVEPTHPQQPTQQPTQQPPATDGERPGARIGPLPVESAGSPVDRSVFDAPAPAPTLPNGRSDRMGSAGRFATSAPAHPGFPAGALPTLPAANPVAPPAISAPIETAPSTPDLNALRSAQLRATKQQQQGKLFGRSLLAVLLIGGLIAAALLFGRPYLFPAKWDARLTPTVDAIQNTRGSDFDHTVPLVVQTADEYAVTVLAATVGTDWIDDGPEWRALGLASGDITAAAVGMALAATHPAVYDPASDTIYQVADADEAVLESSLRSVLDGVFVGQRSEFAEPADPTRVPPRVLGVSSLDSIAQRAADTWVVQRVEASADGAPVDADTTDRDAVPTTAAQGPVGTLPLPIRYELAAIDRLGAALLTSAGADPQTIDPAGYPASLGEVLDDFPTNGASGLLTTGDRPLADPVALGLDDWTLVWANRLPVATVDRLVATVTADSYRPIDRGGLRCFDVLFQTVSEAETPEVLAALVAWSAAGPVGSQAMATQLAATQVQLGACDPGVTTTALIDGGAVDVVIERQLARISG